MAGQIFNRLGNIDRRRNAAWQNNFVPSRRHQSMVVDWQASTGASIFVGYG
jgi:hypothetical protein